MQIGIPPPSFRLPAGTHVGRVRLQVSDLERSLGFYRDLIGFHVHELTCGKTPRAMLGAKGEPGVLLELDEKPGARPVPRRGLLGLYHFAVLLPNRPSLGAFLKHLRREGAHVGLADHAYSQSTYLTDPDGLGIEVYADQPRETWTYRDGEIVGTIDPLDTAALMQLAGETAWTGLPPGTTIGHVHLHIGDLNPATAFYHAGLGFDKVGWSFPGAVFVSAGGYHHHVGLNNWAAGSPSASDADARLLDWQLVVPDGKTRKALEENLREEGFAVDHAGDDALVRDPWGTIVRISVI